jgi:hypothetical protein
LFCWSQWYHFMTFLMWFVGKKIKFYFYFCERMIWPKLVLAPILTFICIFLTFFYDRYFNCLLKLTIFHRNSLKNSNIFIIPNHSLLLKSWTKILFCWSQWHHFMTFLMWFDCKNEFFYLFLGKDNFGWNWFWHLSLLLFVFFQHYFTTVIFTVCENSAYFTKIFWRIRIFETFQTILYF